MSLTPKSYEKILGDMMGSIISDEKDIARNKLKETFRRFGIMKESPIETLIEAMAKAAVGNFGAPNVLHLDPKTFEQLKQLTNDNRANSGSETTGDDS